ncbi:helix-turn-helix domain-containing protein [Pseudomonas sp. GV071]|jgi:Ner family transcriptional regulator|uniref:helix-turn-helix domain-containing protein n=1 Tax=Pseudomonas sp. GV071 TaxID=2135754 RepID=UPI000D376494|nr:helix-turn-helix domain-containing protein [Pseudomonas sp. GV071]PTQ68157.1 Nlp family transcriptional regulator [Pseudomonas sp. GV071]
MNKADIPLDPTIRWEWIKYQLRAQGTSLAKIARELDVTGPAVKNAKRIAYPRVERAIAKALSLKPVQLWPERWNSNDDTPNRIRVQRAENNATYSQENNPGYICEHAKTAEGV